jgi:hypothetical protein
VRFYSPVEEISEVIIELKQEKLTQFLTSLASTIRHWTFIHILSLLCNEPGGIENATHNTFTAGYGRGKIQLYVSNVLWVSIFKFVMLIITCESPCISIFLQKMLWINTKQVLKLQTPE